MSHTQIATLPTRFPISPKVVFSDVDDTLTWQGQLPQATFIALGKLRDAGIQVVPVTGASAGWCDCLLKTLPIKHIVGENGAFWMSQSERGHSLLNFIKPEHQVNDDLAKLKALALELHRHFPAISFTQDQAYRISDVALDIGQAVDVNIEDARAATQWLRAQGVSAHLSSIHINTWIGNHNKARGALAWLAAHKLAPEQAVFIGDSPNDEAMFEHFDHTVGVANIQRFIPTLAHRPAFITQGQGGLGFAELADVLLLSR